MPISNKRMPLVLEQLDELDILKIIRDDEEYVLLVDDPDGATISSVHFDENYHFMERKSGTALITKDTFMELLEEHGIAVNY